jgi:hypothetical protein
MFGLSLRGLLGKKLLPSQRLMAVEEVIYR